MRIPGGGRGHPHVLCQLFIPNPLIRVSRRRRRGARGVTMRVLQRFAILAFLSHVAAFTPPLIPSAWRSTSCSPLRSASTSLHRDVVSRRRELAVMSVLPRGATEVKQSPVQTKTRSIVPLVPCEFAAVDLFLGLSRLQGRLECLQPGRRTAFLGARHRTRVKSK